MAQQTFKYISLINRNCKPNNSYFNYSPLTLGNKNSSTEYYIIFRDDSLYTSLIIYPIVIYICIDDIGYIRLTLRI